MEEPDPGPKACDGTAGEPRTVGESATQTLGTGGPFRTVFVVEKSTLICYG
jgi:hypothetical protein